MNKMTPSVEFENYVVNVPTMTRRDKLLRLAQIIRSAPRNFAMLYDLEHYSDRELAEIRHPASVFAAAAKDPILKDAGLAGDSALQARKFFELTNREMHTFGCGCHGQLTNEEMAHRVEAVANQSNVGRAVRSFLR